jgi:hypothetical protein
MADPAPSLSSINAVFKSNGGLRVQRLHISTRAL